MSTSILIIAHQGVGNAMVNTLQTVFEGELPLAISIVDVKPDCDPDQLIKQLKPMVNDLDTGNGLLILTDLYGATPCNIAQELRHNNDVLLITGLNLPMLIRVMNYPLLSVEALAEKAVAGGQDGIINCNRKP